ncbi:hypothetical protein SEA_FORZA_187 [Gordonia phage Forza]|uniref:Uncharacterized protein n=1 Tax=Gordonia phage Forza TaxID=2571247 RepID=A0A650EZL9_9CAUD|nr:hypothetical protein PP303_gp141 [Gordonia phage Forza]QEM41623.1 hypothetical protein SEA_BOOPY_187 [Gordonia phage Boopy]QGT55148.1 hypothetical protein SEA_FORZA_187 [Gordonia phage Forza]UXE04296.1 hypothetical protein SEA_BLUENGOLD_183 [Gordonia phage BlueNGold]WBF03937.1 hypothetical protein SEA_MAREELIH_184 [Gordonia phage Mareelih]
MHHKIGIGYGKKVSVSVGRHPDNTVVRLGVNYGGLLNVAQMDKAQTIAVVKDLLDQLEHLEERKEVEGE